MFVQEEGSNMTEKTRFGNRDTEKYFEMYVDEDGSFREDGDGDSEAEIEIEVLD